MRMVFKYDDMAVHLQEELENVDIRRIAGYGYTMPQDPKHQNPTG